MNFKVKEMCYISLAACLLALFSQIKIDLPGYVPITLQTLMVYMIGILFNRKWAFTSCFLYLCLGAIGLPVFAGFRGGLTSLVNYTGGYLFAFPFMAWTISYLKNKSVYVACFIGTLLCYVIGTMWFMFTSQNALMPSLMMCVLPFLPGDFVKIVFAKNVCKKVKINVEKNA